ncbi:aldo/keto reductase [Paenibacillus cymbidii]|uniref:aldo/keto reductase n=1 Tax=Paenibacillus cymbidii TaxID=1639034 RepID=UPI0010817004|nr:aldo/keto reductase [Paenibacillus cymbidii]
MVTSIQERVTLNNGIAMPWLGLGVWMGKPEDGDHIEQAVEAALALGYRSIDTAALYGNESGVGRAIKASGVPRENIFVTTKVWNDDHGYDQTLRAFEASRRKLDLDVVDLYLVHWPISGKYAETWRALERLYAEGAVRAIGVSNFQVRHLQHILERSDVVPAVNQVEYHPRLTQVPLRTFCEEKGIRLEAWSPLMVGRVLDEPVVRELAATYGKTPAQVVLRWDLQHGVVTIPKSIRPERIAENAGIFDFALSPADMARLDALNRDERCGPDPDQF